MMNSSRDIYPDFIKLDIGHKAEIEAFVSKFPPYSDFNFVSMLCYDTTNSLSFSYLNNNLVVRFLDYITEEPFYSFLGNSKPIETVHELVNLSLKENISPKLKLVPEVNIINNQIELSRYFHVEEDEDSFDYIISASALTTLDFGSKRRKKQAVKQFMRKYPTCLTKRIDISDMQVQRQILSLFNEWEVKRCRRRDDTKIELKAIERLLGFASVLETVSVGVYDCDSLVGFTINEVVHDGYYMGHFGKSSPDYVGIGLLLEHETAKIMEALGCVYMNNEQDLGITGLKKYKQSYYPVKYFKKFTIGSLA